MSEAVKWQLLSQHLEAMSVVNSEFEDLILLASALVRVLESEYSSMKTSKSFRHSLDTLETPLVNVQEEVL